jgi:hypothetical protein
MGIAYHSGNGTYIAGMSLSVRVTFSNTGGTSATVDAVLLFNGYDYLSQGNPAAVIVAASGSQVQDFTVSISQSATSQNPAVIDASWNGTESISGRSISGDQGSNHLNVKIQAAASLVITSVIDLNSTSPYGWGKNFTARVTVENTGGTAVENMTVQLFFGSATGITTSPFTAQYLGIGISSNYQFVVIIAFGATLGTVTITANATGDELISGDDLSDTDNSLQFIVEAPPSLTINTITTTTPAPYTRGSELAIKVELVNGGADIAYGNLTLILPINFTSSPVYVPITNLLKGTSLILDLNVIIGIADYSAVKIDAHFTGKTPGDVDVNATAATTPLWITVQTPSDLEIFSIAEVGSHDFVQGMQFNVEVWFRNNGNLDVTVNSINLSFNGAAGYSNLSITPFTVPGGSTRSQLVTVVIAISADVDNIIITASATGKEQVTDIIVTKNSSTNSLTVHVTSQAVLAITSIQYLNGTGIYVEPHSFIVRVNYTNTGNTSALNVDSVLSYNGYTYLSSDNPTSITVPASGSAYQDFIVTVATGASGQRPPRVLRTSLPASCQQFLEQMGST